MGDDGSAGVADRDGSNTKKGANGGPVLCNSVGIVYFFEIDNVMENPVVTTYGMKFL